MAGFGIRLSFSTDLANISTEQYFESASIVGMAMLDKIEDIANKFSGEKKFYEFLLTKRIDKLCNTPVCFFRPFDEPLNDRFEYKNPDTCE